jgi:hypothetical protein
MIYLETCSKDEIDIRGAGSWNFLKKWNGKFKGPEGPYTFTNLALLRGNFSCISVGQMGITFRIFRP